MPFKIRNLDSSNVYPHIGPAGIIILHSFQMRVLLEKTTFPPHKIVRIAGIMRVAGIIQGRALYEEIRYAPLHLYRGFFSIFVYKHFTTM